MVREKRLEGIADLAWPLLAAGFTFAIMAVAWWTTPRGSDRAGRAVLRGWSANANGGFWVIPVATAIAGALFAGWQLGVIWFQISSPVTPGSVWQNVAALVTTVIMVVIALVIERICRITEDASDSEAPSQGEALA